MGIKILIIRFSSIGDIVLTTPVIRCLKTQIKNSTIHYLTKTNFSALLTSNPYLEKVYTIEKDINENINELKKENYDIIIDLHNNLRSTIVKKMLGVKSHSVSKLNIAKWLIVNFKINQLPDLHIVDRYLKTTEQLGIKNDLKGLDYFIPEKDQIELATLPLVHQKGFIGFVVGAKHNTKKLTLEKIISIIKKLNAPVVLLGGKEDIEIGNKIKRTLGDIIFNACGKYNINQSAFLVKQAMKIITHDTGLMHIAAAFKKEIYSVWGNTIPDFGMYPYLTGYGEKGEGNIFEVSGLPCRPCTKIGYEKCPKGHFKCILEIDENKIAKTINQKQNIIQDSCAENK